MKASTRKTPQPTPAYHSAIQRIQAGSQEFVGTPERVSALRGACLIRDRHRCVISRAFDQNEMVSRSESYDDDARDDDGVLLKDDTKRFEALEVAHILPHSLTRANADAQLVNLPACHNSTTWLTLIRILRSRLHLQSSTCLIVALFI